MKKQNGDNPVLILIFAVVFIAGVLYITSDENGSFELIPTVDINEHSLFRVKTPTNEPEMVNLESIVIEPLPPVEPAIELPVETQEMVVESESGLVDGWFIGGLVMLIVSLGAGGFMVVSIKKTKTKIVNAPFVFQPEPLKQIAKPRRVDSGFPQELYDVVNGVLLSRGGVNDGQPNYWIERERCKSNPLMWTMPFDYRSGQDPKSVEKYEDDIQIRLNKAGFKAEASVKLMNSIIEISKREIVTFNLQDYWNQIKSLPKNQRACVPGIEIVDGNVELKQLYLKGERAGNMIAGRPGSGKTQVALSALLTMCAINNPETMSLIICDIKGDCKPLDGLAHLVRPVITNAAEMIDFLDECVTEMKVRQSMNAKGDRSYANKAICIYIDELTSTMNRAKDDGRLDELVSKIQDLTMVGRSLGFILIMATQRITDVNKLNSKIYGNCGRRWGLRVNSVDDSNDLINGAETKLHKLPGRGSFQIHDAGNNEGERGQGFLVADPDEDDYNEVIQGYVKDINSIWQGCKTHWTPNVDNDYEDDTDDLIVDVVEEDENQPSILDEFEPEFIQMLENVYESNPNRWNKQRVRETYAVFKDQPNARMNDRRVTATEAAIRERMENGEWKQQKLLSF